MTNTTTEASKPAAAQEAVAYWRVTFRMYRDDPELCVLFVGGQEQPTLDSLGVTPRPLELVSLEPRFVKQHRWDQYGERCLDCGDKDWMNDPVCRQRLTDPCIEATPSIAVDPSTEVTPMCEAAPVAAAPVDLSSWASHYSINPAAIEALQSMLASTPAAPGIDLEQFRRLANSWIVEAAGVAAETKHACADELLALIDASPKGGSDAVQIPNTEGVREILGRMCFQCIRLAQVLRLRGDEIKGRAEDEQAAVLRFLLNHYLASPEQWAEQAQAEIDAIRKQPTSAEAGS